MGSFGWALEILLVGLLGFTLVHAIRLERALRALRNDRAALGDAIAGFDTNAREAEEGLGRLQTISSGASEKLAQLVEQGRKLVDDLQFLIERGETVADRLDELVRAGRPIASGAQVKPVALPQAAMVPPIPAADVATPKVRSKAERDLLLALQKAR